MWLLIFALTSLNQFNLSLQIEFYYTLKFAPRFATNGQLRTLWHGQHFITSFDFNLPELFDGLGSVD